MLLDQHATGQRMWTDNRRPPLPSFVDDARGRSRRRLLLVLAIIVVSGLLVADTATLLVSMANQGIDLRSAITPGLSHNSVKWPL
jgi:hypothetical protein